MNNEDKSYINQLTQTIMVGNKKKTLFNWTFFFAFLGPMISTIVLFAISVSGIQRPPVALNWVLFVVFVPLIITSLVLTQRKELVGAYGETILILIPTFVWLLPGHYNSMMWLLIISVVIVLIGGISYLYGTFHKIGDNEKHLEFKQKLTNVFLRIAFITSSVVSTVTISTILINWGDVTMNFAVNDIGEIDYTETAWIMFVALTTIFDALLLIILGLVSNNNHNVLKASYKENHRVNKKTLANNFMKKTIIVNTSKRRWYHKIFRK